MAQFSNDLVFYIYPQCIASVPGYCSMPAKYQFMQISILNLHKFHYCFSHFVEPENSLFQFSPQNKLFDIIKIISYTVLFVQALTLMYYNNDYARLSTLITLIIPKVVIFKVLHFNFFHNEQTCHTWAIS